MKNKFLIFYFNILFFICVDIPQDQKDKCQKVAKTDDDCLVELDDSYFCCFLKAKTKENNLEASLCGVIEAKEINKRIIKEMLKTFQPLIKDIIFNDVSLMTAFRIFYKFIDSGLEEQDLLCPIDGGSKKGRIIIGVCLGILALFIIGIICCCKKGNKGD